MLSFYTLMMDLQAQRRRKIEPNLALSDNLTTELAERSTDLSWAQSQFTKVFRTPSTPLVLAAEEEGPSLAPFDKTALFFEGRDSRIAVNKRHAFS